MRICWIAAVAAVALAHAQGQFRITPVDRAAVDRRLEAVPAKASERSARIRELFGGAGCGAEARSEQKVKEARDPNIICTLAGEGPGSIVVGAHYDASDAGTGVVDNWSGAALLASLYEAMARNPHRHTIRFVAFSGEESGLYGSSAFVKAIPKADRANVHAMVNLDCIGMTAAKVNLQGSDEKLARALAAVARAMGMELAAINAGEAGLSDVIPFRDAKIPTVDIHSITQDRLRILHSSRDTLDAMDRSAYWDTYRLVLGYIVMLDARLGVAAQSGSLQ